MPNHVTHKILFDSSKSKLVFDSVCPNGRFDFETLIPTPSHIYRGNLSAADEKDFPDNWLSWNRRNWGTKWNAYSCKTGEEKGRAFLQFDTAWSVPYPILAAFANRFNIPFEHRYFDEGSNFWGIEVWGMDKYEPDPNRIVRIQVNKDRPDDENPLRLELKGYVSDEEESEEGE